jgi:predicted TIM-barrel fold metal-dependent hydrolase
METVGGTAVDKNYEGRVIDVDTHLTEPHDLWTARAPRGWEERLPQVTDIDGTAMWVFDGNVLGRAGASGVVKRDGTKSYGSEFTHWTFDDIHRAAYDVSARLEIMDHLGIWAHIIYPNANIAGFGGQGFSNVADPELRLMAARIYNDAMADLQEESGNRLFPMALVPWWDIDEAVREIARVAELGLRGVNTNSDPQNQGLPDLGERHWDPMWEVCSDLGLPVNFHIGSSETQSSWFGSTPWPSHGPDQKLAIGSAMMMISNARVIANVLFSGVLERFPKLKVVSVESGIGWIPFLLQALDYELAEAAPDTSHLSMLPSEYFRRQVYSCFWFEQTGLPRLIEAVGEDNVMFETDFPHPTCLYPESMELASGVRELQPSVQEKVLCANAAGVYRIPI